MGTLRGLAPEASMRLSSFLSNGSCSLLFALGLGLAVRAYPEILADPLPLGFDTVTFYLSKLMTTKISALPASQLLGATNLYYVVQRGVFGVMGDAFVTLKVFPVLLYGLLVLSIYYYAERALKLGRRMALLASLRSFLLSHGISYALFPSPSNPFAGFGEAAVSWERTTAVGALLNGSTLTETWGTWELYNLAAP